jgi:leucyl aminopeptidase
MPIPSAATVATLSADGYDATIVIASNVEAIGIAEVAAARAVDTGFDRKVSTIASSSAAGGRLIVSPTGPLNKDGGEI